MTRTGLAVLAAVVGLAVPALVAGCTTVPDSSAPQIVQTLPVGAGAVDSHPSIVPTPGADPRTIVHEFLEANALGDPHHNAARAFLTTEAKNRWSDSTVTVIDEPVIGNVTAGDHITVTGQQVGTIDSSGVYTPSLPGNGAGAGGVPVSPTFTLARVHGQWRITTLQNGLLVGSSDFLTQAFQQHAVWFFDLSGDALVPDPRWTEASSGPELANWLMARLADGPRASLQTMLPDQTDPKRVTVTIGADGVTRVAVPGAAQLGAATRDRLAAQIAMTLSQVPQVGAIEIVDGADAVRIPASGSALFTESDVTPEFTAPVPSGQLYYVRDGGVYAASGAPLPGQVGRGAYGLTSVALTTRAGITGPSGLAVAGTRGPAGQQILDIGTGAALVATSLHGPLSRPTWDPTHDEVWIGDGARLERVSVSGQVHPVRVTAAGGSATGRVTAVRLSPEGARVALVLTGADGTSQLWVGTVVRTASTVRVDGLTPISPQGVDVTDVAWNDPLKLFTIGHDSRTGQPGVWEVQCDGSRWTERGTVGLPQAPDSITVAEGQVAAVSAGPTVWKQRGGYWVSLRGDSTRGSNPVYLQ